MRVAVVIASNLYMAPYARYYTEILEKLGVQYDIISWNQLGVEEAGVQAFNLKSGETKRVFCRIIDCIRYQRFVKSKLVKGSYDKVIIFAILNTLLLFPFLKKRYKNNYVFDIRDYSAALKYFSRARFSAAIKNAAFVVISSAGFKRWLPKDNTYVIQHNTNITMPLDMLANIEGQTTYKILTIGSLRDFEANRALIKQLGNSPMFELEYIGSSPVGLLLKDFVTSNGITNVKFLGRYAILPLRSGLKEDEAKYLQGVSFINILTDEGLNSMTLMTNRFYLSVVYGVPMMVSENTEQARWVKKYHLGVVINKETDIKEQIMQYLRAFDREKYNAGRKACLQIIQQDVDEFEGRVKEFLVGIQETL
ncbi:MAG: hypothetical protein ABSE89_05570 [Sedimentisphaerales bacterium]